ncbi:uncharacterized protein LACBIDRAFT_309050 [Laccaria bicolor S238N-H82]|uniref:Predicted protein n=1 Tax=Laccaria bicolor (strain S238N-H82 / ATCC MYA-4686) TaxID=486041 RepID=B0CVE8_LACBS|nr:uncharacterized protein LACBIDRAFT_309050 [Laccaria bicolor S238N-H82]EDR13318.1 predicted protein [Laccaria bicolor S238N-H82]|eukprot:XP_001875816.1 predicted protein [Laccaria bicolor S238N-H82]
MPLSTHSRHPSWNSHSPLELDPFVQDSLQANTSYPTTNSFALSSDPQTSTPIYYNTFHGQHPNPHPFHGVPMRPNYFHPTAYMTQSPLPLQNASLTVLNTPDPAPSTARSQNKRSATSDSGTSTHVRKKRKTNTTTQCVPEALVPEPEPSPQCGIGPSILPSTIPLAAPLALAPQLTGNASSPSHHNDLSTSATDVWFFLRALDTPNAPEVLPTNKPILTTKPSMKFIGCKLYHKEIYESTIRLKNLKHAKDVSASTMLKDTPYTKEKFKFLLCRWIVTDDQSGPVRLLSPQGL